EVRGATRLKESYQTWLAYSFPVGDGPNQGCPLSQILFIIFIERMSRHSQVAERLPLGWSQNRISRKTVSQTLLSP
uniref:Reverse transcriptase domain-containing protein n=1 Tax=Oreochromis niloticus TaxID=8128 RepID=A0A669D4X5_ORENI